MIFLLTVVDFLGARVAKPWSETKNVNLRSHSVLPFPLAVGDLGTRLEELLLRGDTQE